MNKKGFTLTEMMIVLLIISGLMFFIIPNMSHSKNNVDSQSCEAYTALVNSQYQAYLLSHSTTEIITIDTLVTSQYITSKTCPDGTLLEIKDGKVQPVSTTP